MSCQGLSFAALLIRGDQRRRSVAPEKPQCFATKHVWDTVTHYDPSSTAVGHTQVDDPNSAESGIDRYRADQGIPDGALKPRWATTTWQRHRQVRRMDRGPPC